MKKMNLLENQEFNDLNPHVQTLLANNHNRIMRFMLKPGQLLKEHQSPSSAVNIVVLEGHGLFSDAEGNTQELGPLDLIVYEPGEKHAVQALEQNLVFLAILKESPMQEFSKEVGVMA